MNKYKRLYNRISVMPFPEYFYRLKDLVVGKAEYKLRKRWLPKSVKCPGKFRPIPFLTKMDPDFSKEIAIQMESVIEDVLAGKIIFHERSYNMGASIDWHRDPDADVTLPLGHGKNYHSLGVYSKANIVFLRFLNRHTYLVYLAIYVGMTGEKSDELKSFLRSWIKENPYLEGLSWSDAWQVGARVINWCLILSFGYEELKKDEKFMEEISAFLMKQAGYVYRHPALYSSANNHLLCEYICCAFVVILFPESNFSRRKSASLWDKLAKEVDRQFYEDGFHKEQTVAYQWFTLDYLLLLVRTAKALEVDIPSNIEKKVANSLDALSAIVPSEGQIPHFSDGGFENTHDIYYQFYPQINKYFSLLARGANYFQRPEWLKTDQPDPRSLLLFGGNPSKLSRKSVSYPKDRLRNAGYYIFDDIMNNGAHIRLTFDCGPFGLPTTYAHAHADMLNFVMDVNRIPFLIDSGTFDYHPKEKKWRDFFRGTSAHNTVVIDGLDQAESGGNMLWLTAPEVVVHAYEDQPERFLLEASHDGYQRLKDPVIHRRRIEVDKLSSEIRIIDQLECAKKHAVELCFHFSGQVITTKAGQREIHCEIDEAMIHMKFDESINLHIIEGDSEIPQGWLAVGPEIRLPHKTAIARCHIDGVKELITTINIHSKKLD